MPHDGYLAHLKQARHQAYQRRQTAGEAMNTAWKRRSAARDILSRAYQGKQRAYDTQQATWQEYQRVRSGNGPRIDSLNAQQEVAFQKMKDAFDQASSAHNMRDGASARLYADQGHRYKQEAQDCVAERRRLVQEIRDARDRHETAKSAFQWAKEAFATAKRKHDQAKEDHERKQAAFKQAKAELETAVQAVQKYLEAVRGAGERVAKKGRLEGRWYSKYMSGDGSIQVLLDKNGNVTDQYPHVHVIHDEPGGEIRIHVTHSQGRHSDREVLPGSASGNEVNAAIERALRRL